MKDKIKEEIEGFIRWVSYFITLRSEKITIFDWFKNKSKPKEIPKHIAKKKSRKKRD